MELQSEKIGTLATALAKAQGEFEGAKKSASNPHLNKAYADINSVLDVIRAPLSDNGIAMTQPCIFHNDRQCVMTQITHGESGEWMRSIVPVFEGNQKGAQGYGSGVTYARRYGLSALLGVGAEDDDGHGASGEGSRPARNDPPPAEKKPDPAVFTNRVKAKIDGAESKEALQMFWMKQDAGLMKLKAMDADAHQSLQEAFTAKLAALSEPKDEPPLVDDDIPF